MSSDEGEQTRRVRDQGRPGGLFRACMDSISTSHTVGQALRHAVRQRQGQDDSGGRSLSSLSRTCSDSVDIALPTATYQALAAGLLSDSKCYAELLGQFYLATAALETRVDELLSGDQSDDSSELLVAKTSELGYSFSKGYALDLQALLGSDWEDTVRSWATEPTKEYVRRLRMANDDECTAAAFILHGPLIIGGGAALKPRVEKSFGPDATNVFEQVIGMARGGRSARRKEFIDLYDTLLDTDKNSDERFHRIVEASGQFRI